MHPRSSVQKHTCHEHDQLLLILLQGWDAQVSLQDSYLWSLSLGYLLPWDFIPLEKYFYAAFLNRHLIG